MTYLSLNQLHQWIFKILHLNKKKTNVPSFLLLLSLLLFKRKLSRIHCLHDWQRIDKLLPTTYDGCLTTGSSDPKPTKLEWPDSTCRAQTSPVPSR